MTVRISSVLPSFLTNSVTQSKELTLQILPDVEALRAYCLQNDLVDPHYRMIKAPPALPKLPEEALILLKAALSASIDLSPDMHISHERLILFLCGTLKEFSCTFLLRGSKAAELLDPLALFCAWHHLSVSERNRPVAHDTDWYCRFEAQPPESRMQSIRTAIFKALPTNTTHHQIQIPEQSNLVKTAQPFVLASIGKDAKADFAIGQLQHAYLFLRDAFAIEMDGTIDPSPYFWQAVTDHALGIVRLEKRHELDFYAFMAALEQRCKGAVIVEEETTLQNILRSFPDLTAYELDRALKKRIRDHQIEPFCFLLTVLEEMAQERPELAEEVWKNCLPFIKSLPQERLHPLSRDFIWHAQKNSFQEMHTVLQQFSLNYPFTPRPHFFHSAINSELLRAMEVKVLLFELRQRPYPVKAFLRLVDLFLDGKLGDREKKMFQELIHVHSVYALVPIELLRELLKTPDRLKDFSIDDPLIVFKKCAADLQIEILCSPLWRGYFVTNFQAQQFLRLISSYSLIKTLKILQNPLYLRHVQDHLLEFLRDHVENLNKLKPGLQAELFQVLFRFFLLQPQTGETMICGEAFNPCTRLKGFKAPLMEHSQALLKAFSETSAFVPLLQAHQTHQLPIPTDIFDASMPLANSIELAVIAPTQYIEPLLKRCAKQPAFSASHMDRFTPLVTDPTMMHRCEIHGSLQLKAAHLLLQVKGKEALSIQIVAQLQVADPDELRPFLDDLLKVIQDLPSFEEKDWSATLKLIEAYFQRSSRENQVSIAAQMQSCPYINFRGYGYLWEYLILEKKEDTSAEELLHLFDGALMISMAHQSLLCTTLANSGLIRRTWSDPRVIERIYDLFEVEFQEAMQEEAHDQMCQIFIRYMSIQGKAFLNTGNIPLRLIGSLAGCCGTLYIAEHFQPLLNLFYIILTSFQLNGRDYPQKEFDPHRLYAELREDNLKTQASCEESAAIRFLCTFFFFCTHQGFQIQKKARFLFKCYYQFLKVYLKHNPSPEGKDIYLLFIGWILNEDRPIAEPDINIYLSKLILLGNQAGYLSPEDLTLYQLLALQPTTTNVCKESEILNQITALSAATNADLSTRFLRLLNLIQFLITHGSKPSKDLIQDHLYGIIESFSHFSALELLPHSLQIFVQMKAAVLALSKLNYQIPMDIPRQLAIIAKRIESLPKML